MAENQLKPHLRFFEITNILIRFFPPVTKIYSHKPRQNNFTDKKDEGSACYFSATLCLYCRNTTLSEKIQRNIIYTQIETLRCHNTLKYSIAQLLVDS